MHMILKAAVTLTAILALTTAAAATEIGTYGPVFKKAVSEANIKSMLDVTKTLKKAGASYVPGLAMPPALARKTESGESMRMLLGMYQFDAVHAAAFGRKAEAVEALKAREELVDRLNLRGRFDASALFPKALDDMLTDPESVTVDAVIQAYVDNAGLYENILLSGQEGAELIEASLYGLALEGIYAVSQSLAVTGVTPQNKMLIQEMAKLLEPISSIYSSFTSVDEYARTVDPHGFLELGERNGWMRMVLNLIKQRKGDLTTQQIETIADFVAKERAEVLTVIF